MDKKADQLINAIKRIYETEGNEIGCDQILPMMAQCADLHLSPEDSKERYPQLWQHLNVCEDCLAEYEILMDLATHSMPEMSVELSIPKRPFIQSDDEAIWQGIRQHIKLVFSGFTLQYGQALTRGNDLDYEPVQLSLGKSGITLALDIAVDEEKAEQRELYCHLQNDELEMFFEGCSIWIGLQANWPIPLQTNAINAFGDASFYHLQTKVTYNLAIQIGETLYEIEGISLP